MHPLDTADRTELLKDAAGHRLCNITKCCTEVCPEGIKITDNAIIPLKERVADRLLRPAVRARAEAQAEALLSTDEAAALDGDDLDVARRRGATRSGRAC